VEQHQEQKPFETDGAEKLFYAYVRKSYILFLDGEDNYESLEAELGQLFST